MNDEEDVLSQADALMRRHRSFIARGAGPVSAAAPPDDPDIPLLTEVIDAATALPAPTLDEVLDVLHEDLEQALDAWLIDALPVALANASQHILTELDTRARHSLLPQLLARIEAHRGATADPSL